MYFFLQIIHFKIILNARDPHFNMLIYYPRQAVIEGKTHTHFFFLLFLECAWRRVRQRCTYIERVRQIRKCLSFPPLPALISYAPGGDRGQDADVAQGGGREKACRGRHVGLSVRV
jgi:hypothetical protein